MEVQGFGSCDSAGLVYLCGQLLGLGHCWGLLESSSSVIVLLKSELAKFCVSLSYCFPFHELLGWD